MLLPMRAEMVEHQSFQRHGPKATELAWVCPIVMTIFLHFAVIERRKD